MSQPPPLVSICIPTHNRSRMLAECIDSIAGQDYPLERLEVFVFDDASGSEEAEQVKQTLERFKGAGFSRFHLTRSEQNVKMLMGRQALSQDTSLESEFLLFVDDDGLLEPDTLSILVKSLDGRSDIGAVGPRIVAPGDRDKALQAAFFINSWTGFYAMRDSHVLTPCDWLNTTCLLVRKEAFLKVGGFDVSFEQSHAEADLCLRLKASGYAIFYQPKATAVHNIAPRTTRRERLYHLYRNKFWVIRKHFHGLSRLTALGLHALLGTPKHLAESVWTNKTINRQEWRVILQATRDGLFS